MNPGDDLDIARVVSDFVADYADCIDEDNLERWPDFFAESCVYQVTTEYNRRNNLPIGIIYADNRNMLEDRVAAIRKANVYEPQRYRHIVSTVRVRERNGSTVHCEASFIVVRIMGDGNQDLYVSGRYFDRIDLSGNAPVFAEKIVVLDSDRIDTLLAIPI